MKISELFEGQMLLESYKDYKRVYREIVDGGGDFAADRLKHEVRVLSGHGVTVDNFPDFLEKILRNQRYIALLKSPNMSGELSNFILNNLNRNLGIRSPTDVSSWLRSLNSRKDADDGFWGTLDHYHAVATLIELVEKEIANRTPDYTTVAKTSSYIIFDVKNFAAAQKLRNQLGATCTWCIGANEGMFKNYGEYEGRKTYIVYLLKTKKGLAIHVNPNNTRDNLVTSHSNDSDTRVVDGGFSEGRGEGEVGRDIREALTPEETVSLFRSVGIMYDLRPVIENDIRLMNDFLNKLRSDPFASNTKSGKEIIRRYKDVFQSDNLVYFLSVALYDSYIYFRGVHRNSDSNRIRSTRDNLATILHIIKHINTLVAKGVIPRTMSPSVRLPFIVEELLFEVAQAAIDGEWGYDVVDRVKDLGRKLQEYSDKLDG